MNAVNSLVNLSRAAAVAPSLTQGGGGNTSVKDGEVMVIKSSGFRLDEVSESIGFVKVKHEPVKAFLQHQTTALLQPDTALKQFVNEQIIGNKTFLPSMETGFHAILKDYVIHTHPVIVNLVLCCKNAKQSIKKIYKEEDFSYIPMINPGYYLSKEIADIEQINSIIFLENHGLIVHADTEEEVIRLHTSVIEKFNNSLSYECDFNYELNEISDNLFMLDSKMLGLFFSQPSLLSSTYFPDQAVVIGNAFQFSDGNDHSVKINFDTTKKQCFINGHLKNALAISENLMALANIVQNAHQKHWQLNALPEADVAYILGMDMEKYRQGLLK